MNTEDATNWRDSNILFINDEQANVVDLLQSIDLDHLQVTTSSSAIAQLMKAAKKHDHYQLVFIQVEHLTHALAEFVQTLSTDPAYRFPIITVFTENQNDSDQYSINQGDVYDLPQTEKQLVDIIEVAYQQQALKKQDLIQRLNTFNPNILVVEDDMINQQIFKLMLDSFNCRYDLASTGNEALQKNTENNYDVVLLDIGLPDIDGFEVTRRIRAEGMPNSQLPVIAVTAFIPKKAIAECQEVGMNDVITKPVMLAGLQYAIACNLISRI